MNSTDVKHSIIQGIKEIFYFNNLANIDSSYFIKPEYLLTVKIAEQLALSKKGYLIKLEEDTSTFAKSCVKSWNNGLVNDDSHNSERNGKIDIAVYSTKSNSGHYPNQPLFPIEIKNINPSKYSFLKDVERNIEFFNISDVNTGDSVLELSYNVAIEEFKDIFKEHVPDKILSVKEKYKNWIQNSNLITNDLSFDVFAECVDSPIFSINDKPNLDEGDDPSLYFSNEYTRIGVIVEIYRKPKV
ncbi:hypothetical protein GCM10022389_17570 [Flavobacterium cheonanense]|uniref:Uncharacterized protein n=1 Tax=Flavobacterium cheonanense TaxID=706183 RepID=A0ABP7VQX6_9FLAO